jgi:hypothetical protein
VGSGRHREKEKRRVLLVARLLGWVGPMGLNGPTETQGGSMARAKKLGAPNRIRLKGKGPVSY